MSRRFRERAKCDKMLAFYHEWAYCEPHNLSKRMQLVLDSRLYGHKKGFRLWSNMQRQTPEPQNAPKHTIFRLKIPFFLDSVPYLH